MSVKNLEAVAKAVSFESYGQALNCVISCETMICYNSLTMVFSQGFQSQWLFSDFTQHQVIQRYSYYKRVHGLQKFPLSNSAY
jgi:hypothetical protein